jgi:hypothetical protein
MPNGARPPLGTTPIEFVIREPHTVCLAEAAFSLSRPRRSLHAMINCLSRACAARSGLRWNRGDGDGQDAWEPGC